MPVDFKNVTDITILEGNVIKIHETASGRVLWEKKSDVYTKASIINSSRICYFNTQSASHDESSTWISTASNNSLIDSSTRWFVDITTLPAGLCVKCDSSGSAYVGILEPLGTVIPQLRDHKLRLLVITYSQKIYDENTVFIHNTNAGAIGQIARKVSYSYIAPDISTAPEIIKA